MQPIIVCGMGRVGKNLVNYLASVGARVVCIDSEAPNDSTRPDGVLVISGDCRLEWVLKRAGVERASALVAVTSDEQANIKSALTARGLCDDIPLVVRLRNDVLIEHIGKAILNLQALSTAKLAAPMIAAEALKGSDGRWSQVGDIRLRHGDPHPWEIVQMRVPKGSRLDGLNPRGIAAKLGVVVAGIGRNPAALQLVEEKDEGMPVQPDDNLLLAGPGASLRAAARGVHSLADEFKLATWNRRIYRTLRSAFPYDLSVPLASMALVLVLLASTILFATALEKSLADAMFRTVSIIATGADMHEGDYNQKPWLKVFVSALRIAGAALLALFTALLTKYFVNAKLGDALLVARVPDSGHIVVCGLGRVGVELVRVLEEQKLKICVVEIDPQGRHIEMIKRRGIPVIIGDASSEGTLQQACAKGARAVVAVTADDLANLQIALVARSLCGQDGRIVFLQSDESIANAMREESQLSSALSIPELVAPAIAAAVFGEEVHSLFRVGGLEYAVVGLPLPAGLAPSWESVRAFAARQQMMPLFVTGPSGSRHLLDTTPFPAEATVLIGLEKFGSMREKASKQTVTMTRGMA